MPYFEGTRPQFVDQALKSFYNDMASVSRDASFFFERVKYSEPVLYISELKRKYITREAPANMAASIDLKK